MPRPPARQSRDPEQDQERDREEDHRDRGGSGDAVAFDLTEDEHRGDLRLEGEVAGDQDERAELAHRTGESERDAGEERGQQVRQDDAAEDRRLTGAEGSGGLLHLPIELEQYG